METRCQVDASIANYQREFEAQKAEFDVEVNHARAEADLANELQVGTFIILVPHLHACFRNLPCSVFSLAT